AEQARLTEERTQLLAAGEGQDDRLRDAETQLRAAKERLGGFTRMSDGGKSGIAQQNADIALGEGQKRSMGRQLEDIELRMSRSDEEERRLRSRKGELDDEIAGQEQRLGGLHEERLNIARTRQTAEERVKDLKLLISRLDKEVDQLKGDLHKK